MSNRGIHLKSLLVLSFRWKTLYSIWWPRLRSLLNSFFEEDFWVKSTYPLFPPEEHGRTQIPKMNFLQETVRVCTVYFVCTFLWPYYFGRWRWFQIYIGRIRNFIFLIKSVQWKTNTHFKLSACNVQLGHLKIGYKSINFGKMIKKKNVFVAMMSQTWICIRLQFKII